MTVIDDPGTGRYRDWLRQAENDLQWGEHSLAGGFLPRPATSLNTSVRKRSKPCAVPKVSISSKPIPSFRSPRPWERMASWSNWPRYLISTTSASAIRTPSRPGRLLKCFHKNRLTKLWRLLGGYSPCWRRNSMAIEGKDMAVLHRSRRGDSLVGRRSSPPL
jgi:hypothetical protein